MPLLRFWPIFLLTLLPSAQAAAPSGETWFTLISPNFRVHHTAALEPYARAFGHALERGLPILEKDLHWELKHKPVDIVIMDPSDAANGLAINFPNTHIEVYSMVFETDSPLSHYVNWVNELATHELTHIVANDTSPGFYGFLRTIFGSWVKPNGLEPGWMSEGLAVYQETAHTNGGRGRSPLLEAILRTAVRESALTSSKYTSLDRFNDGNEWWPGGHMAYLMGYTIQALPTKANPNFPGKVSRANAGKFPFSPHAAVQDVVPENWYDIWNAAPARLQERYGKPSPMAATCKLSSSGSYTGGHALSPDGWIYFSQQDFNHGHYFSRVRADAPCGEAQPERLFHKDLTGPTQVAVSPSGKYAAFAAFDREGLEWFFSDLYLWDNEQREIKRLTDAGRVRDPAFSGDSVLLYVKAKGDLTQAIIRRDLRDDSEKEVYLSKPLERVSGLTAQGEQVVFALHNNNGQERLHSLHLGNGKVSRLAGMPEAKVAFERNPFLAPNGDVYFAASYDYGTQDIYLWKNGKAQRVLATEAGFADRPQLMSDGRTLLYQGYSLNGFDLVKAPLSAPGPVARGQGPDLHEFLTGEKPQTVVTSSENYPIVPYSAVSTPATSLWPQYWLPEILAANDGALIGASTSGNDPLEYHRYGLSAQYDTRAKFPTYLAFYQNRQNIVNLVVRASQINDYFTGTRSSNRSALYSAQAIVPIGDAAYSFGGAFQERTLFGLKGQNTIVFQNFHHSRFGKSAAAISPNFGHTINAYLGLYPSARNENFFADMRPSLALYFKGFHPSHSISFQAQAGITTNSILASNYYQGGGATPLSSGGFIVRGYPTDTLFGQRIATANLAYTFPIAQLYRGLGTAPVFFDALGLRLMGDVGTSNYAARYRNGRFWFYEARKFMRQGLAGAGMDLLLKGSLLYHVPVTLVGGFHYGFEKKYGGEAMFIFGLDVGMNAFLGAK